MRSACSRRISGEIARRSAMRRSRSFLRQSFTWDGTSEMASVKEAPPTRTTSRFALRSFDLPTRGRWTLGFVLAHPCASPRFPHLPSLRPPSFFLLRQGSGGQVELRRTRGEVGFEPERFLLSLNMDPLPSRERVLALAGDDSVPLGEALRVTNVRSPCSISGARLPGWGGSRGRA